MKIDYLEIVVSRSTTALDAGLIHSCNVNHSILHTNVYFLTTFKFFQDLIALIGIYVVDIFTVCI